MTAKKKWWKFIAYKSQKIFNMENQKLPFVCLMLGLSQNLFIINLLKIIYQGNSLAVQWSGLRAFTAVAQVQSLVRELRSRKPHDADKIIIIISYQKISTFHRLLKWNRNSLASLSTLRFLGCLDYYNSYHFTRGFQFCFQRFLILINFIYFLPLLLVLLVSYLWNHCQI